MAPILPQRIVNSSGFSAAAAVAAVVDPTVAIAFICSDTILGSRLKFDLKPDGSDAMKGT